MNEYMGLETRKDAKEKDVVRQKLMIQGKMGQ